MSQVDLYKSRFKNAHGNKYYYIWDSYAGSKKKMKIVCPEHGEFEQEPSRHAGGQGCRQCGNEKPKSNKTPYDTAAFIERARAIHGNRYSYDKTVSQNSRSQVTITCPEHGDFVKRAEYHLTAKQGCPHCVRKDAAQTAVKSQEYFLLRNLEVHGRRYDYAKSVYTGKDKLVTITCPEHGDFQQTPNKHHSGQGCPACGRVITLQHQRMRTQTAASNFEKSARKIHGNKYSYHLVTYVNSRNGVTIICPVHGEFRQSPANHLAGKGCARCSESHGEREIAQWLDKNKIAYEREVSIPAFNKGKRFDFYLPELKLYLEYDGAFHFEPHFGKARLLIQQERDRLANVWCALNGVRLERIKHTENLEARLTALVVCAELRD